jgi:hypothetical protein
VTASPDAWRKIAISRMVVGTGTLRGSLHDLVDGINAAE